MVAGWCQVGGCVQQAGLCLVQLGVVGHVQCRDHHQGVLWWGFQLWVEGHHHRGESANRDLWLQGWGFLPWAEGHQHRVENRDLWLQGWAFVLVALGHQDQGGQ